MATLGDILDRMYEKDKPNFKTSDIEGATKIYHNFFSTIDAFNIMAWDRLDSETRLNKIRACTHYPYPL